MKKITLMIMAVCGSIILFAQAATDKFTKAMEQKIAIMDSTRSSDGWKDLAAAFERIGNAEKTQWLPYYYAAYSHIMIGYSFMEGNPMGGAADKTDPEADLAEKLLAKAIGLAKENSETWVLKKMIASLKMMGDPMSRYMTYGPAAAEALATAKNLDASNPRVYMLEAQDKYFTPEQFGGSKDEAKVLFDKSKELFGSFKPESSIHPNWGLNQVIYFLSQYK